MLAPKSVCSDGSGLHFLGMGSFFHRVSTCIAAAIQVGAPCFIDDREWWYHRGHLQNYFKNSKICSSEKKKNITRIPFVSTDAPRNFSKYVLAVPEEVKTSLEFCHEDPLVWYRGVILKHMLYLNEFSKQFSEKLMNGSGILKTEVNISDIISVHIRSTDKISEAKLLEPGRYLKTLKYACLVFQHLCRSNITWIATDNRTNLDSFVLDSQQDINMKNLRTFGLNVSVKAPRFNTLSLMQILTDLQVLSKAK